jgi:uncharacterized membrane-anchored protein YitT (DUF2179 family)
MKKRAQTSIYKDESRLFYFALSLCMLVVCTYMYFVSMTVVHVVLRKEVDNQIAVVGTQISQLEERYIEKQHNLSVAIATQQGFVTTEKKTFIDKTKATFVLSNN